MAEWIYFIHPPREDFADTMTAEEEAVWAVHFERFQRRSRTLVSDLARTRASVVRRRRVGAGHGDDRHRRRARVEAPRT